VIGGTEYLHCGVLAKVEEEVGSGFRFHDCSMAQKTPQVKGGCATLPTGTP
jgi:hypothetical protein